MKKIHRFFCEFYVVDNGVIKIVDNEIIKQVFNVIKLKNGEDIVIFNNEKEIFCNIKEVNRKFLLASVKKENNIKKNNINISLYCAVLKKDNFEIVIQKATELGINNIYPIITERTIKTNLNFQRLEKIIKESSEQSGRNDIPKIFGIKDLKNVDIDDKAFNILFNMNGKNIIDDVKEILKYKNINFFIGPEGGWTEKEILSFKKNKFKVYCLSKNVLRGETAAIFGAGIISLIKNN